MPSNAPRLRLRTWDKLSLCALDKLSTRHPQQVWFDNEAIKAEATALIEAGLARVSSNPGAVGTVSSCLNRFAEAGIVVCASRRVGSRRRRRVYRINVTVPGIHALLLALASETASAVGCFDYPCRHTQDAYAAILRRQPSSSSVTDESAQAADPPTPRSLTAAALHRLGIVEAESERRGYIDWLTDDAQAMLGRHIEIDVPASSAATATADASVREARADVMPARRRPGRPRLSDAERQARQLARVVRRLNEPIIRRGPGRPRGSTNRQPSRSDQTMVISSGDQTVEVVSSTRRAPRRPGRPRSTTRTARTIATDNLERLYEQRRREALRSLGLL